ncbi:MAG: hypothetical protein K0S19_1010 [Geminicoccaceae bacterium]|nr:hypothetical protein [Geminicoccaceae bacterium]
MVEQMRTVQRWQRNQVEETEDQIEPDAVDQHPLGRVDHRRGRGERLTDLANHGEHSRPHNGQDQVGDHPCGGDQNVTPTIVTILRRVDRYRLRSAKGEAATRAEP